MKEFDVIVKGVISTDLIFSSIPKHPRPGEEVYCGDFKFTCGSAFITAVALSRLGLKVGIVAPIGNDFLSDFILSELNKEGVSTNLLMYLDRPLEIVSVSINYKNERSFYSYEEGYKKEMLEEHTNNILKDKEIKTKFLHISGNANAMSSIRNAKKRNIKVLTDIGWDEEWLKTPQIKDIINSSDFFTPNLKEALYISNTNSIDEAFLTFNRIAPNCKTLIKLGEEGVAYQLGENINIKKGAKKTVIDATGAGDVFSAGLLSGLIKGYNLEKSLDIANFCGSCSVEALGGATSSPTWDEVEQHLSRQKEKFL